MGRWLTIKDKRALIAKVGENPGMTHAELAEWSTKTYNLGRPLARSTVSDILRKAPQTMSPAHEDTSRRKLVKVTSIRLEKALWAWIALQETRNIVLSRELIAMKARELQGQLCDAWDLSFSEGWMTRFMKRHGLKHHQELFSAHRYSFPRCERGSSDEKEEQRKLRRRYP
ncbi:hypothetical protein PPTG_16212 [Phytophthora nicotianae INRA-310]|uniref:HTH CENPB-type domain-containing protein n=1 Tax=Phytophthora nicotianae (strain INRA-310) TaxID=761204 RepID=W2PPP2_PHYN3|nr:hypothetical protein PPTG_16212 [Phytophthora nicotianae INRA-310]ETN02601.1 hypothetical protein PPTG_16212 [Phytophthora nicotianae INRA-310]